MTCFPRTRTTSDLRESFANPSVELTANDWLVSRSGPGRRSPKHRAASGPRRAVPARERRIERRRRERDRVRAGLADDRLGEGGHAAGASEASRSRSRAARPCTRASAAFRRPRRRSARSPVRGRRVDTVVHELERVRDLALAAAIRGAAQQGAVEGESRGAAAVEAEALTAPSRTSACASSKFVIPTL